MAVVCPGVYPLSPRLASGQVVAVLDWGLMGRHLPGARSTASLLVLILGARHEPHARPSRPHKAACDPGRVPLNRGVMWRYVEARIPSGLLHRLLPSHLPAINRVKLIVETVSRRSYVLLQLRKSTQNLGMA